MKDSKYLTFIQIVSGAKTNVWNVMSKSHGAWLGRIYWYEPWRQYAFWPNDNTVWNRTCLADITTFIQEQMDARKVKAS